MKAVEALADELTGNKSPSGFKKAIVKGEMRARHAVDDSDRPKEVVGRCHEDFVSQECVGSIVSRAA